MASQFQSLKLSLINIGYAKLDYNWNFDQVISPFTRLYLITKGEAFIYHNNKKFQLVPGNMYLVPSYTYSSYKCNEKHEQFYISFFEELGSDLSIYNYVNFNYDIEASSLDNSCFERLLAINPKRALTNNNPKYYDIHPVLQEFEKRNINLTASEFIETQGLLKVLFSRFIDAKNTVNHKKSVNLNGVTNFISENLHKHLPITDLADFCHLSKDHFSRSFKKDFGVRPNKFIQLKRIERAIFLLLTTNYTIKDIANSVGFEDYGYFTNVFKNQIGQSPAIFRKNQIKI